MKKKKCAMKVNVASDIPSPSFILIYILKCTYKVFQRESMSLGKVVEKLHLHYKCRNSVYPKSSVVRFTVPDDKVPWEVGWRDYDPVKFTSSAIKNQPWADPPVDEPFFRPAWNTCDNKVNRKSHFKRYKIVDGFPLNPVGRTGVTERGVLGRWGPNHAADPIITRWKRNSEKVVECNKISNKPILQFVGVERKDCREWAIPGGMVDPGEEVTATLKREFLEEAMNILCSNKSERVKKEMMVEKFFTNGLEIYKGYVDDPRNTDNAWMETVATNFHDEDGMHTEKMYLTAGDDAAKVKWIDIDSNLNLYASHLNFIAKVAQIRNSHW